mmetsp:Transcript_10940/g.17572  ORF Transcript_10940/g.17572 Transcript_10940/m.17572 type:complete len:115 (-) Transcript_10940:144-488(-)|eukprot:CAMPEP_0197020284 /NCGR_PEP_ID=MMETSP1384-20130603/1072_1 /TAXON_ID=29189 /ORGANISM="Ammonia sp." /LENGTH=114 /DNA_ID=CAMNT_0042447883 /DNA_START=183 /DNA_END=527 /DNA_ORIENTATION=+
MPKSIWGKKQRAVDSDSDEEAPDAKVREVQLAIEESKDQVNQAIIKTIERGDQLEDLADKADNLQNDADLFNRQARKVRRAMCWQNIKMNLLLGGVIIVVALIIYFAFIHPLVN